MIGLLEALGMRNFAEAYREYYLSAWVYFLSGYSDSAAARSTVAAAITALRLAANAAETVGASEARSL